jgi:hypothetical protein
VSARLLAAAAALAASLAALAACGDSGPPANVQHIAIANPYNDRLKALDPPMQRLGLMRAIRDNGNRCHKVQAVADQGDYRGLAMWVALCDDGRHWAIFIAATGDTQVRNCADARQLRLPVCRPLTPPAEPIPNGQL